MVHPCTVPYYQQEDDRYVLITGEVGVLQSTR